MAISHRCPHAGQRVDTGKLGDSQPPHGQPGKAAPSREARVGPVLWQAVHGRAELPLAPDEYAGLAMVLLLLLALCLLPCLPVVACRVLLHQ